MRKIILFSTLLAVTLAGNAQLNISFLGNLDYQALHGSDLSNLWGYTDETGKEYAIVGTSDGVSVVDVTNPATPIEIFYESGSNTVWREVKTFGDYAYISTESHDGMMIIDLSPLPGSTALPVTYFNGAPGNLFQTAHSLFIDENGILFLNGTDVGNGGIIMYDVAANPTNPPQVGTYDTWYVHDCFARGDTLYAAHIYDGFVTIVDVSNHASPVILGGPQNTPMNFAHNVWLDDTGNFIFTTDEKTSAWIGAYDISDLGNISEVDRVRRSETSGTIPHNTYWVANKYLVTSYYRDGVTIHDVSNPSNMIEVGNFDTSPLSGDGFNGAWGVYAYLPSGNLLISDMEEGLFVLAPTYVRACFLDGTVTEQGSGNLLNQVHVEIVANANFDNTDLSGFYATGVAVPGSYDVIYSKTGYYSDTVNVSLSSNVTVTQNVQLVPLPSFSVTGQVTDFITSNGIMNAQVLISNSVYSYTAVTDGNGNFTINTFIDDATNQNYTVTAGQWGYVTECSNVTITSTSGPLNVALSEGYYDDFTFDFGWTGTGSSPTGLWQRAEPVGTTLLGLPSNPDVDATGDCSDKAFVTGNAGGASGDDDVDNGNAVLISPAFTTSAMASVSFHLWMRNGGGSGMPNDTVKVILNDNGVDKTMFKAYTGNFVQANWISMTFNVHDFTSATTGLRLKIIAQDYNPGHVLEAGLDRFEIDNTVGINENTSQTTVTLYPNPGSSFITVASSDITSLQEIRFYDASGKLNLTRSNVNGGIDVSSLASGMYVAEVIWKNGYTSHTRFIKQ